MSFSDRDLRDALQPLAGDAMATATRVLAALPAPRPPLPPLGWWLLGGGLLLGFLGGFLLAPAGQPAAAPTQVQPPKSDAPQKDQPEVDKKPEVDKEHKDPPPKDPTKDPSPSMMMERDTLLLMAFGSLGVDEPGKEHEELKPGQWYVQAGTAITTDQGTAGILAPVNDLVLRLDVASKATVSPTEVALEHGRLFVNTGSRKIAVRIDAKVATVQAEAGCCLVTRQEQGVAVLAVRGQITVRTARSETARLDPRQQVWIDPDRGMTAIQQVPFLPAATSWMTEMILLQNDWTELQERIQDLVQAFQDGAYREPAARELRKLGARAVPALVKVLMQGGHDADFTRATLTLISDLADYSTSRNLFELIASDDAELRVAAFHGIQRATGSDGGKDAAFWRDGSFADRLAAAKDWWQQLYR